MGRASTSARQTAMVDPPMSGSTCVLALRSDKEGLGLFRMRGRSRSFFIRAKVPRFFLLRIPVVDRMHDITCNEEKGTNKLILLPHPSPFSAATSNRCPDLRQTRSIPISTRGQRHPFPQSITLLLGTWTRKLDQTITLFVRHIKQAGLVHCAL